MEEKHRRAIQTNFTSLVEQTDLDHMVASLYEKGVFSEAMIEPYKDTTKDTRMRKRQLYRDIERRGPKAFKLLVETLTESGHWDLVRVLEPDSILHPRPVHRVQREQDMYSLKEAKKIIKEKQQLKQQESNGPSRYPLDYVSPPTLREEIPKLNVVKSETFMDESELGIPLYRTRSTKRGLLLAFTFIQFENNIDKYRKGAEVDSTNLKYLFNEIGFQVIMYKNLTKDEMEKTMKSLNEMVGIDEYECVFVLVSSHGYESIAGGTDTDIRCSDGGLVSARRIVEYFNNINLPRLRGVPKVFIIQACRGPSVEPFMRRLTAEPDGSVMGRSFSDILIANSTLPGFVSVRDTEDGSWFIQSLCEVFAARAHDCHVEDLFKLVDRRMAEKHQCQTSSVDNWGFNSRLYLHPGLFEASTAPKKDTRRRHISADKLQN